MKNRIVAIIAVLVLLTVCITVAACSPSGSNYTGTYYDYTDGVKSDDWIKLEKDTWSDNEGMSGRVEYSNGMVYCYLSIFGEEEVLFYGTVKNGVFTYTLGEKAPGGDLIYYNAYTDSSKVTDKDSSGQAKTPDKTDTPTTPTKTYTVKFDSKGGSEVAPKIVKEGEKLEAPNQPTKTMYVFAGWYKESGLRNVWDFDTDRVTGDITLYAKWASEEVRITAVDGATIEGNDISIIIEKNINEMDMSDKVVLNSDTATWKLYYDKMGRDEIRTKIATSDYGRLGSGSNLFYIVVTSSDETQSKTYTLDLYKRYDVTVSVYDVEGEYIDSYSVTTLDALTAPDNLTIAGYTVKGWKSSSVKVGEQLPKDAPANIRLTPDATPNTYTVTYQANGGRLSKTTQTVTYAKAETLAIPTQEGYTFTGWTLNGEDVTDGTGKCIWRIAHNATLTARYRANHYAVTVSSEDTNAGTATITGGGLDNVNVFFDVNNADSASVVHTQTVTTTEGLRYPAEPSAEGYLFRGWYKDGSIYNFAADLYSDIRLTADWYKLSAEDKTVTAYTSASLAEETYAEVSNREVRYYFIAKTGGTYTLAYRNTQEGATYGARIVVAGTNGIPIVVATNTTRNTLTFSANAGNVCYISLQRDGDYNTGVYFSVYGGNALSAGGKVAQTDTNRVVLAGNGVTLRATQNTGYTFVGWYKDGKKLSADLTYSYTSPAANSAITARYTAYTLTTDTNLTNAGTYTLKTNENVTAGTSVTITATTNNGYTWLGWYDGDTKVSEGTSRSYTFNMPYESKNYTAKWQVELEMKDFYFTSTTALCAITGVKDINITSIVVPKCVTDISSNAFSSCRKLTSVTISNSVTSIGNEAFKDCSELTSITIPNSVTSIGLGAFSGCSSLESITIPFVGAIANKAESETYQYPFGYIFGKSSYTGSTVTRQYYYGSSATTTTSDAYYIPDSLCSVTVTGGNILRGAFYGCSKLSSVAIGNDVTSIGERAFYNCSELTSVTIGNAVISIGYGAFYNCSKLTSVTIGDGLTAIGHSAFYGCSGLTSITIPAGVTSIGEYAFSGCIGLTTVSIPDSVTSFGYGAFSSCKGITIIGNAINTVHASSGASCNLYITSGAVGDSAFDEHSGLLSVAFGEGVTSIGWRAFRNCNNLTSVTLSESITIIGSSAFQNCSKLTSFTFAENSQLISIGHDAFRDCNKLTSIDIPEGVISIEDCAFYACSKLTSITIPNSVASIEDFAFYACSKLTSITIPNSVASIGDKAFQACYRLVEVYNKSSLIITEGDDSNGYVAYYAKNVYTTEGSSKLSLSDDGYMRYMDGDTNSLIGYYGLDTILNIPNDITEINRYAFINCSELTSITIPNSITSIGMYAFNGCKGLTSITVPNSVTAIGLSAFSFCSSLESITIPFVGAEADKTANDTDQYPFGYIFNTGNYVDAYSVTQNYYGSSTTTTTEKTYYIPSSLRSVTVTGGNILYGAFYNCKSLYSITIPNSVTSIGGCAFYNCNRLTSITIPNSVTSIGQNAFSGCSNIAEINFNGDIAGWCGISGLNNLMNYGNSNRSLYINGILISEELVIPDGVTSIGDSAFKRCEGLTSVSIPSSVISIGGGVFSGCSSLVSITVPFVGAETGKTANDTYQYPFGYLFGTFSYTGCSATQQYYYGAYTTTTSSTYYIPTSLRSVTVLGGNILYGAFYNCNNLTSITIGDGVTSIGSNSFYNCSNIAEIHYTGNIAGWCRIAGLNIMAYGKDNKALYINNSLITEELVIPNGVISIPSYAFYGCKGLTFISIPDGVITIGQSAFSGCSGLTSIIIPNSVTSIEQYAFSGCSGLTSITIPDNVTSIGRSAFSGCSSLESITIPFVGAVAGKTSSDNNQYPFGYIFGTASYTGGISTTQYYYTAPEYVPTSSDYYIPTSLCSVTVLGGNILYGAFYNCNNLTSITLGDGVTSIKSGAFYNCSNIAEIHYTGNIAGWCGIAGLYNLLSYTQNKPLYIDGNLITGDLVVPNGVSAITSYAFYNCSGLTSVTIPGSVDSIGDWAFSGCDGLTSISIAEGVTTIGRQSFDGCSGLTSIIIPNSITSIGWNAFSGCSSLESITIPFVGAVAGKTSSDTYQYPFGKIFGTTSYTGGTATLQYYYGESTSSTTSSTFYIPTSLRSVTVTGNYILRGAFYGCSGLTSVVIGNSVTSIAQNAFNGCRELTSVSFDGSVTSIGNSAFYRCDNLTEIRYNGDLAGWCSITGLNNIMKYGKNNKSLYIEDYLITGDLIVPEGVVSIGDYAFKGCNGLTAIIIPNSVTSIGDYAFYGCSGLTNIDYQGTKSQWSAISKGTSWNSNSGNYTIHCTDGDISK